MTGKADFAKSSKSGEAYTPREWWQRCIDVLGHIDCDPASDPEHHIPARIHYTKNDNGLRKEWPGKVFLNPPFGRGVILWFEKAEAEMKAGRCTELIILWKCALETESMQVIINMPAYKLSAVPDGRISFLNGDSDTGKRGSKDVATFTPMFSYIGDNPVLFAQVFGKVCTLWKPRPAIVMNKVFWSAQP
jgi:hypothetical protein